MTMKNPFRPLAAEIRAITPETYDTATYTIAFKDEGARAEYRALPGQFNMLTVFGVGEAPISVSSGPSEKEGEFKHTIRHVGDVTNAISKLNPGDTIWVRGPYGTGWPMNLIGEKKVLIVAGGIGLAPLRPVITELKDSGRGLTVLYGAKTPADLLFIHEFEEWSRSFDFRPTVDKVPPGESWDGRVGLVTELFEGLDLDPSDTLTFICGPEIMMRFASQGLIKMGFDPKEIYVSLERRMECGVNKCGKCQIGSRFVCKDGPVFALAEVLSIPGDILGGAS